MKRRTLREAIDLRSRRWALTSSVLLAACASSSAGQSVELPAGAAGIGFDDLRYSAALHRVLVPSGRSGRLNLIDPDTLAVTSIAGFSAKPSYGGGHDDGPTSVEEAVGKLYVTDRTSRMLVAVDPVAGSIQARTPLSASPDYVRFVEKTGELWVTEPAADQVEIFKLDAAGVPVSDAFIAVENGPESIVVDASRGRVYTHRWQKTTVAIDVTTRTIVAEWPNGCAASRGIALDEEHGWLFAGCNEGTAVVLDVEHDGALLSTLARGSGFDVIGYDPQLRHLDLAGGSCGCLILLGVTTEGQLQFLERFAAPSSTHCVAADDVRHAWVCDPDAGRLLRVDDTQDALP